MAEGSCCFARTTKILCPKLGATRHGMTLGKSLATICLGSSGRCILITCDIHQILWLVCGSSVCVESSSDWAEEFCFRPAFFPELQLVIVVGKILGFRNYLRTAPSLYRKVAERRGILSFVFNTFKKILFIFVSDSPSTDTNFLFFAYLYRWLAYSTHLWGSIGDDLIINKL